MHTFDLIVFLDGKDVRYRAEGDRHQSIEGFSSIYQYRSNTITWLRNIATFSEDTFNMPEEFACVITGNNNPKISNAKFQIWVDDPKNVFFDIVECFWGENRESEISPFSIIEDGAQIGKNVSIGPHTFVSSKCVIGDGTIIGANVTLKGRVHIGQDCVIQSGAVLGEDGFAFIKEDEKLKFVKHYGGVLLEDHVSIGSNTCVCRGAIDDTTIKEYAKIDNLCHIAHNVIIGKRVIVVSGSVIMGSVHIGDDCWIAPSMIRDQRHVGSNSVVGMGSVVVENVPDNTTVAGNPAKAFNRREKI